MVSDRKKSIITLAVTLSIFILIGIYLVVAFFKQLWPFQEYTRPPLPDGYYYPTGQITDLTAEELERNQKLLTCFESVGVRNFDKECVGQK